MSDFLLGSKAEIALLLEEFDRIGNVLPVWAMRLVNGLRYEWQKAEEISQRQREQIERPLLAEVDSLRLELASSRRALRVAIEAQGEQFKLRQRIIDAHEAVCNEADCSAASHYQRTEELLKALADRGFKK